MLTDFVPAKIDATRWEAIEPLLPALLTRPVGSAKMFEKWLIDRSELEAACAEAEAVLYIAMTCHTEDEAAQRAYTSYIETVPPLLKPLAFELDKRQTELARKFPLDPSRYGVLNRDTAAEVEIFRDVNVPIQTELEKLGQQYQQLIGAMMVSFDGREQTLPMMARYQESADRSVREGAWRTVVERRLKDRDAIDANYERMIGLRHTMALNAGFKDFVGYAFKSKKRFDYTPADCRAFHEACEKAVVPFMRRQDAKRKAALGVASLRPWDLSVDPKGRGPLKPFEGGVDLMRKSVAAFNRLDPRLGAMLGDFAQLLRVVRTPRFALIVLGTLPIWAVEICSIWSICGAVGVDLKLAGMLALMGGASLSTLLPTAPGYVGSYQFAFVLILGQFGIGATAAIVAATTVQIYLIGGYTLIGLATWAISSLPAATRSDMTKARP